MNWHARGVIGASTGVLAFFIVRKGKRAYENGYEKPGRSAAL